VSPSTLEQAVDKVIKSAEITMQNAILLQQEVNQLCAANQCLKRKQEASRYFIATDGSLTGAEEQQKAQEYEEQLQESSRPQT